MTSDTSHVPVAHGTWYPGIEILRGCAAVTVVACHLYTLNPTPSQFDWLGWSLGGFGVTLFFLLSGFLLADTFWAPKKSKRTSKYWVRRFFRIAPAYYASIAVLFLFFAPHNLVFSSQGLKQILANMSFTQYLWPETSSSFGVNGSLWTLTLEFAFYLVLPFIALAFKRLPWVTFVTLVAVGVSWKAWIVIDPAMAADLYFGKSTLADNQAFYISHQFPGVLPIFMIGIAAKWLFAKGAFSKIYQRLPKSIPTTLLLFSLIPALLMGRLVFLASNPQDPWAFVAYDYVVAFLMVPAVLLAAIPNGVTPSHLRSVGVWLGERSYGIYLWHFPIILSVYGLGPDDTQPDSGFRLVRAIVIVVLTLVFADVSFRALERPAQSFGKKLNQQLTAREEISARGAQ